MTSTEAFRQSPKFLRGRSGEKHVAELLQASGWYVIPSYDYTGEENKAPKMQGLASNFVIPDLDTAKDGKRKWAEVKTKAAPTLHRVTNTLEHGIDRCHYDSYLEIERITGCAVWLFVYEEDSQCVLFNSLANLKSKARFYTGDKMRRGGMVFFPRVAFKEWR